MFFVFLVCILSQRSLYLNYLLFKKDGLQNVLAYTGGLYIAITNNSIYPQPKYEGIKVASGFETNVGVERTFYYKLPTP